MLSLRRQLPSCLLALALSSGCVHRLPVSPDVRLTGPKLPLRAAVVLAPSLELQQDELGAIEGLGSAKWVMETGRGLSPAIQETARRVFSTVTVVPSAAEAGSADIVLVAGKASLSHPAGRGYVMRFELHAVAQKPNGKVTFEQQYVEEVAGSESVAASQGAAGANQVLSEPAEKAIAMVLTRLAADLRARLGAAEAAPPVPGYAEGAPAPWPKDAPPPPPPPAPEPTATDRPAQAAPAPVAAAPPDDAPRRPVIAAEPPPEVARSATSSPSARRLGLLIGGGAAFVVGYVLPIIVTAATPYADTSLGYTFIPIAGAIIGTANNPVMQGDAGAWTMAILSTVLQVGGLTAAALGLLLPDPPGASSSSSLLPGNGWHVAPTVMGQGFGVSLVRGR